MRHKVLWGRDYNGTIELFTMLKYSKVENFQGRIFCCFGRLEQGHKNFSGHGKERCVQGGMYPQKIYHKIF